MSDRALDFVFSAVFGLIGIGVCVALISFAIWLNGEWHLRKCAAQHNVYACVYVATPVRGATE